MKFLKQQIAAEAVMRSSADLSVGRFVEALAREVGGLGNTAIVVVERAESPAHFDVQLVAYIPNSDNKSERQRIVHGLVSLARAALGG